MPIYMDIHNIPGVSATDVAEAHRIDVQHQDEFSCKCMTYWIDEGRANVFCLIEAPNKESVVELHRSAHGLIPNKIIEVSSSLVESFLGRIYDPADAKTSVDGLKVFKESSFRILLVTKMTDPVLLAHELGPDKAGELLNRHHSIIRQNAEQYAGREVEHGGPGFILAFTSTAKAMACAFAIQKDFPSVDAGKMRFKICVNAGEPVENSNKLFGDTIQLAEHLCTIARNSQVAITSSVKELISKDYFQKRGNGMLTLTQQDETFLITLFQKLEEYWRDPDFEIADYCRAMAMSKSQLYRKTILLTGLSPNILLKDYRLEKAKELLKKQSNSISQITFESGFTSPSYFTKCFKKKYGLLPMAYLDLLSQ